MKVFWALVLVLLLAAGGMLLARGRGAAHSGAGVRESSLGERAEPAQPAQAADQSTGADDGQAPIEPATAAPEVTSPDPVPADEPADDPADEPADEPADQPTDQPGAGAWATAPESVEPAPAEVPSPVPVDAPAPGETGAEPAPVVAEAPPGTLVLNERYQVPGLGTEASPYVVSWDTLTALESEYNPKKEGMKSVPEWITALDGKHVAITGFIAFPFIAPTADECMVMLNQWDGCCIGVPPTPYDAVEVKLASTLDLQQGIINYGTITGVFRTDPYLVNEWLIGLYVMEGATVSKAGGRNQGGF